MDSPYAMTTDLVREISLGLKDFLIDGSKEVLNVFAQGFVVAIAGAWTQSRPTVS